MAHSNLNRVVVVACLIITIEKIIVSVRSSSVPSNEDELDEKTKDALRAQAGMNTSGPGEIDTALYIAGIIPDVLDRAPNLTVTIKWSKGVQAELGNKISPEAIKEPPQSVSWEAKSSVNNKNHYFTLLLTGLDHPSKKTPNQREFLHWHQVNIQGYSRASQDSHVTYLGPKPANGTGKHRYVVFVYQQPSKLQFDEPVINETDYEDTWRIHWDTRHFAKKYNLGDPHSINFFYSEFQR